MLDTNSKKILVSEISTASLRLNQQVENLLNMSRLESGFLQLHKDWCDVNELIYKVVIRFWHYGTDFIQSANQCGCLYT